MSRTLTTDVANAATAAQNSFAIAVRLDFASGLVRVNSTPYPLTIGGEEFIGVGHLGSISGLDETSDFEAPDVTLELSGVQPALVYNALQEKYQGRDARIYWVFFDDNHAVIPDPVLVYRGTMDTMDIEMGEEAVITVHVINRFAEWKRARTSRYTDAEQQTLHAGDLAMQYVDQLAYKSLPWGVIQK